MSMNEYDTRDCDPSGEGCENCPRYLDDCDGNEKQWEKEEKNEM